MENENPFYRSEQPKNAHELLKWLVFDPIRLKKFEKILSKTQYRIWLFKTYPWVIFWTVLMCLLFYLMIAGIIARFDLPIKFPAQFKPELRQQWNQTGDFLFNFQMYTFFTYEKMVYSFIYDLPVSLVFSLTGFAGGFKGLAWLFVICLGGGLAGGLTFSLAESSTVALVYYSLVYSLAFGLALGLAWGLALVNGFVLTLSLISFLAGDLAGWLAFYLFYFRLYFYPFHLFSTLFQITLTKNPYLKDAVIWLPIPGLKNKLLSHTWNTPDLAFQFADFLLEYRPLQKKLAYHIIHTATAATWYYKPLYEEELIIPLINSEDKKAKSFIPSHEWLNIIEKTKNSLITAKMHHNSALKKEAWEIFHQDLQKLEKITLRQSDKWKADYLKAIRVWIQESEKKLNDLNTDLQRTQPIAPNQYRVGEALKPNEFGKETFSGRQDICDELSFRILTSATLPTLLLQGQRRVGKTSLLNFLQQLLGSRFAVIQQDCQSGDWFTFSSGLNCFKTKAENILHLQNSDDPFPQDPLDAWNAFEDFFTKLARQEDRKIILAFDEYESFHALLKKQGENGERILGAMRSFSQHQNHVVFLFTGMNLFADLGEPDFSRYFVHAHRLRVDYLKKEDAEKLITNPYEGFNLIYPPELTQKICHLTCCHPALLQHICYEMVSRANQNLRKEMTPADLQAVLKLVLDRGNPVMISFWRNFCNTAMRQTVREIMNQKEIRSKPNLMRLLDYGFIVKASDTAYKMRVPLFEKWIDLHGDSFEV